MCTPCTLSANTATSTRAICRPQKPGIEPNIKWSRWHTAKIHFKFSYLTAESSTNRSADPKNPTLEPNTEWFWTTICWDIAIWNFARCVLAAFAWFHRSCDHWLPISGPLWPYAYLARLSRYGASHFCSYDQWPSSVTWPLALSPPRLNYPALEPNRKWIGWPVAEMWSFWNFPGSEVSRRSVVSSHYTDVIYSTSLR